MKRGLAWSLLALSIFAARALDAQAIQGRVVDAQTELAVPQVLVEVLFRDDVVGRALTDADGRYQVRLASRKTETYALRASRIGYASQDFTPIEVGFLEVVDADLRMSTSPIPLAELEVEVRRVSLRNAATHEGLHARRERALPVGPERVVVRGDPELKNAARVQDVLQQFFFGMSRSRRGCVDYFVNGELREGFDINNIPIGLIEGIEYYVDGRFAPTGFTGSSCNRKPIFKYSIVAVWFRQDPT
jgi:hypothetical protein